MAENAELRAAVEGMRRLVTARKGRVADPEERLDRNPRDSSSPPPSELFAEPAPSRVERRAARKKQGKQPGAPGRHLAQVTAPDHVVRHTPPACGSSLEDADVVDAETRQVFELPAIRLVSPSTSPSVGGAVVGAPPRRASRPR